MRGSQIENHTLDNATAVKLASLLELSSSDDPVWSVEDLAALLRIQLSTPLVEDLRTIENIDRSGLEDLVGETPSLPHTFRDLLLEHPAPPAKLLGLVKEYAKGSRHDPDPPVPEPIALVLYYAALAAAELRCYDCQTTLTPEEIRQGLRKTLALPWIDSALHNLFQRALDHLTDSTASD